MNRTTLLALLTMLISGSVGESVSGPAGVYTVTTSGPTRVTSGAGWVKIEWDVEQQPPPSPPVKPPDPLPPVPPPPGPTTPPPVSIGPLAAPIWLAAVYDRATVASLPKGQQELLASKTISTLLKGLGATWSVWDKSDPGLKDWGPDAGSTYPVVLVIWAGGQKSKTFPLASDEQTQVAFVRQVMGK